MVKYKFLFFIICFYSCGIKTRLLDDKITDVPLDNKIFTNKNLFLPEIFSVIDTNSLYKEEYGYLTTADSFERGDNIKEYQNTDFRGYYKFYSNGLLNAFYFKDFNEITISSINPNFKGKRGIVYNTNNEIKVDLFTIVGYGFKRDYGILTSILQIKGDSIFEKQIRNPKYVNVYVKKEIRKEYLIYKPNW